MCQFLAFLDKNNQPISNHKINLFYLLSSMVTGKRNLFLLLIVVNGDWQNQQLDVFKVFDMPQERVDMVGDFLPW